MDRPVSALLLTSLLLTQSHFVHADEAAETATAGVMGNTANTDNNNTIENNTGTENSDSFAVEFDPSANFSSYGYLGVKLGPGSIKRDCHSSDCDREAFAYGVFAGYQSNPYLGVEMSVESFGNFSDSFTKDNQSQHYDTGLYAFTLAPTLTLPLSEYLALYLKAGMAAVKFDDNNYIKFMGEAGVNIAISEHWDMRLAYEFIPGIDSDDSSDIDDIAAGMATIGLSYRFGQSVTKTTDQDVDVYTNIPPVMDVNDAFNGLSRSVYFKFNQVKLTDKEQRKLDDLLPLLKEHEDYQINLVGYADNVGSDRYNFILSQKRSDSVKKYLIDNGINAERIISYGMGKDIIYELKSKQRRVDINIY